VSNLSAGLAEAGRRAEGLAAAQEAVELRRELVALKGDAYLPDLAGYLAADLADAGRRAGGRVAAQEASLLYHEQARTELDVFGPAAEQADAAVAALSDDST
jgi:hypothetical protein